MRAAAERCKHTRSCLLRPKARSRWRWAAAAEMALALHLRRSQALEQPVVLRPAEHRRFCVLNRVGPLQLRSIAALTATGALVTVATVATTCTCRRRWVVVATAGSSRVLHTCQLLWRCASGPARRRLLQRGSMLLFFGVVAEGVSATVGAAVQ